MVLHSSDGEGPRSLLRDSLENWETKCICISHNRFFPSQEQRGVPCWNELLLFRGQAKGFDFTSNKSPFISGLVLSSSRPQDVLGQIHFIRMLNVRWKFKFLLFPRTEEEEKVGFPSALVVSYFLSPSSRTELVKMIKEFFHALHNWRRKREREKN